MNFVFRLGSLPQGLCICKIPNFKIKNGYPKHFWWQVFWIRNIQPVRIKTLKARIKEGGVSRSQGLPLLSFFCQTKRERSFFVPIPFPGILIEQAKNFCAWEASMPFTSPRPNISLKGQADWRLLQERPPVHNLTRRMCQGKSNSHISPRVEREDGFMHKGIVEGGDGQRDAQR